MRAGPRQAVLLVLLFALGAICGGAMGRLAPWQRAEASGTPVVVPDDLALFVLAGQSNMSGRGPWPATQATDPRVFVLGNDYRWRSAAEPLDDSRGQVDAVSADPDAGFSPGLAFATTLLAERPDLRIGLIPCAKGGSTIDEWRRDMRDTTLYGSCLKRIRAATTTGRVRGVLFFQGEADAIDPARDPHRTLTATGYASAFTGVVEGLRRDIGGTPVPVVFAQIGAHNAPQALINWEVVQTQQAAVRLECGAMIVTRDLSLADAVHYTTPSYRTIGTRFAAAYASLTTPAGQCR